jgi:HAMP domain-containing protein
VADGGGEDRRAPPKKKSNRFCADAGAGAAAVASPLLSALEAIAERGNPRLQDRAGALRKQVEQLQPSNGDPDVVALGERLQDLDQVFSAVRATADPQAAEETSRLAALRDRALTQVNGGVAPDEFEARRRELLSALDAIERSGIPAIARARVPLLRQRVLALGPGSYGDGGLRDERARQAKQLARVAVELELTASGQIATPAALPGDSAEEVRRMVDGARARLAALEAGGRPGAAETPAEIRKATTTLSNLLAPCLKCHVMTGAKMAPVAAVDLVFQHARFTHKPHIEQANCLACHKSVATSITAVAKQTPCRLYTPAMNPEITHIANAFYVMVRRWWRGLSLLRVMATLDAVLLTHAHLDHCGRNSEALRR